MALRNLVERLMLGKRMANGIEGTAIVVARTPPPSPKPKYIGGAKLNLIVETPVHPRYKVKLKCSAPGSKYPPPSVVPVRVDPTDPQRVQIAWEKILTADEQFDRLDLG